MKRALISLLIVSLGALGITFVYLREQEYEKRLAETKELVKRYDNWANNLEGEIQRMEELNKYLRSELEGLRKELEEVNNRTRIKPEQISRFIKLRQSRLPSIIAEAIAENIVRYSEEYNLPPSLLVGIIEAESITYNPMAVSSKGAIGLMQIMYEYHKDKIENEKDLFEIDVNIRTGSQILAGLLEKHGLVEALSKYRGGHSDEYLRKIASVATMFRVELAKLNQLNQ